MSTNGYNSCLNSVATLQRLSHWLPTHVYTLPYTLATPENAMHLNPLVNALATLIWAFRYALVRCCRVVMAELMRVFFSLNYANSTLDTLKRIYGIG